MPYNPRAGYFTASMGDGFARTAAALATGDVDSYDHPAAYTDPRTRTALAAMFAEEPRTQLARQLSADGSAPPPPPEPTPFERIRSWNTPPSEPAQIGTGLGGFRSCTRGGTLPGEPRRFGVWGFGR